ncbi:MAG: nicotinamide-nucleotide amidohydrolase family protein [Aquificae bacterium]|nr:nicotinamide-nucleotide amidohydrolase family protein [Aquificota bacterium]
MKGFIVVTGTEFVDGIKPEKNSLHIARESLQRGIEIIGICKTPDDIYRIEQSIRYALDKADIVFVTGGLGATSDDLTREAIQEAIGVQLIYDKEWLEKLKKEKGKDITEKIKKLAKIPYGAVKIENPVGSAVGFLKVLENKVIVALPGIPSELKAMLPIVFEKLNLKEKTKKIHIFRTFGLSEIEIDNLLSDIDNIYLNTTPKGVDIFLKAKNQETFQKKIETIKKRLNIYIYAEGNTEMEEVVGKLLKEHQKTISTAESSTGGLIASRLINVPGSSSYVIGGIVAYSNEAKIEILKINPEHIQNYGAVSEIVAEQMAKGVKNLTKTDLALSDTGIAGPTGGTKDKPIGLHYIGFATEKQTKVYKEVFKGDRNDIRMQVSQYALNLVRLYLTK